MKQEIEGSKELEKLKNAPQYIDLFCNIMRQKFGDNQEAFKQIIDEAIAYYKTQEGLEVYTKLVGLQLEYHLIYGALNKVIDTGEEALTFIEGKGFTQGIVCVSEKLMLAYMHKGLLKKAEFYRVKATTTLQTLQETQPRMALEEQESKEQRVLVADVKQLEGTDGSEDLEGIKIQKLHIRLTLSTIKFYMVLKEYKRAKELLIQMEAIQMWLTPEEIQESLILWLELDLVEDEIEKAMDHVQEAHSLLGEEEVSQKYALAHVLRFRAILNGKRSLHMQADKDFKAAEALCENYKEVQIKNLISWSEYLMEQEKDDEAYGKVTRAIKLAGKIDSPYFFVEAYERLGRVYEHKKQWELAYKALSQLSTYKAQMESVQIGEGQCQNIPLMSINQYKEKYEHFEQIARLGKAFTAEMTLENLPKVIHKEIAYLINMDVVGIARLSQNQLEYHMYELSGKWITSDNDLMKYTKRLVDYSTQFQADIIINNGNFEEYTIKNIINSETNIKLQSMIVFVLKVENKVVGAMTLGSYKGKAYGQKDIAIARVLASYLGLLLKNTHLKGKIQYLGEHDALTGLLLRPVVLNKGEKLFKENHKKHKNTAIIMLDIDLFKQINAKYGDELGDEILSKIGKIIKENVPKEDFVGRYNGEEFIVILNDLCHEEIVKVAENIKQNTENLLIESKKNEQIKVTLSGGIYVCNEYTLNFNDALRFANHALYRAKLLGRNRIISYSLNEIK